MMASAWPTATSPWPWRSAGRRRDEKLAASVEAEDSQLDELEVTIDELVINHMATHAPVATDCRFMLVASKISSNLERIADQATAIARRSIVLNKEPLLKPLIDIPRMANIAEGMLRDSITALIDRKPELAQEIIKRDKEVDQINKQLARELTSFMLEDPHHHHARPQLLTLFISCSAASNASPTTARTSPRKSTTSTRPSTSATTAPLARPPRTAGNASSGVRHRHESRRWRFLQNAGFSTIWAKIWP